MDEDTSLIAFKTISNFVNDLASVFGKKNHSLKLYRRLINKAQITHDKAIKKHLDAYSKFCVANREAILEQDETKLIEPKINYSDKVFIDMSKIFPESDKETKPVIWQHILTISAILDPHNKAKEVLKKVTEKSTGTEADFLNGLMDKIQQSGAGNNPMEAVGSILQGGGINDLVNSMQSGDFDIGKLVGMVQGMVGNLNEQAGDDPEAQKAMGMINGLSGMLANMSNQSGLEMKGDPQAGLPDMSGLMGMMAGMMGNMTPPAQQPTMPQIVEETEQRENTE